jgi:glycosyltransferase involved in cell wall biosynthesis
MIKVLLLNDLLAKGGKERRIVELLKYAKQNFDIEFEIILMHDGIKYPEIYETKYPIHVINWSNKKCLTGYRKIKALTKAFEPDIIHSWSSMTDIISVFLKLQTKKKFISSMIALSIPSRTFKNEDYFRSKLAFPFADVITSNTKDGLKSYNAPVAKSICIYNGFNYERISQLQNHSLLRNKLKLEDKFIVGMVAAFEIRKDYETFINTALILLKQYPGKITFILIGDGVLKEHMMVKAGKYIDDGIIFTGLINNVEEYVNFFDVGVLCTNSLVHGEGISNSILEYMALGKPVIATEGGGTNEILLHEETGYLVPYADPKTLSEKIIHLMENRSLANKMGLLGKEHIQKNFSIKSMCDNFYEVYSKLVLSK